MIDIEITFNSIALTMSRDNSMWLLQRDGHHDGEGMQVSVEEIEQLLQNYYEGRF